jgi:diguanylate cyclase (GGDEF)-like protein/PAS domain S-box-containing protein
MAILFLLIGDPLWLIAAANLTYLIGIALPSVAVWLLRRDEPNMVRPYRAPRGTILLGLLAAAIWGLTVVFGFQQFGLSTVLIGFLFASSGSVLYAWRKYVDRRKAGLPGIGHTLHIKLTGAMLIVLVLDSAGYLLAVNQIPETNAVLITALQDIFVIVALLTFSVGLILPGMIAHSAVEVSKAVNELVDGTMADFERAMHALAAGDLDNAKAKFNLVPVKVFSHDEVGDMAVNFNRLQVEIGRAIDGLNGAREGISKSRSELKVYNEQLLIAATAFESQEGMLVTDADKVILQVNRAFTIITGYTADESIGKLPSLISSGRHDQDFYASMWESINNVGVWEGDVWNQRKSGEDYPQHLIITAVKGMDAIVTNYVATMTDISARISAEEEINHLAFYDHLTHLPNRRLLIDRLTQALAFSTRSGLEGALLFIDLDHFKTLNDSLGHAVGDLLLQQVAKRLLSCVREGDTVARLGGDEFVVVLEGLSEQTAEATLIAEAIGKKILTILNQPYQLAMHEYTSSSSIGVTLFNDHKSVVGDLLKQADIAMYQAKKAGRNTLQFFDTQMQDAITARVLLEGELRKALENRQFELYYQIQVDSSDQPIGAEVLIRWIHPDRGFISPEHFIPLAEAAGLIFTIGQWVLDTACAQLKAWQLNELTKELVLAVNVSAKQFRQLDFVAQVQATVQHHAINPNLLKLELTESLLLENIEDTIVTMNALNEIGLRFSLDDFGTGYSSLQYLKRLPLHQLKIDQSFVRDIADNSSDQVIVRTIVAMAQSLNLKVIAEGVETEEQRQHLLNNGCLHYQGYLFGRPVPLEEFLTLLKKAKLL